MHTVQRVKNVRCKELRALMIAGQLVEVVIFGCGWALLCNENFVRIEVKPI